MSSLINMDMLVGIAKSKTEFLSKAAEKILGVRIPPQELRSYIAKAESLVTENKHKLTSKNGLKNFLKNDIGASSEEMRRVSGFASKYADKVPFGKDAMNIFDEIVDDGGPATRQGQAGYARDVPAGRQNETVNNSHRETYYNADRYKLKK